MSSGNSNKKLGKILQHRDMQAILFKFFLQYKKKCLILILVKISIEFLFIIKKILMNQKRPEKKKSNDCEVSSNNHMNLCRVELQKPFEETSSNPLKLSQRFLLFNELGEDKVVISSDAFQSGSSGSTSSGQGFSL